MALYMGKVKIAGSGSSGSSYVLSAATDTTLGGIKVGMTDTDEKLGVKLDPTTKQAYVTKAGGTTCNYNYTQLSGTVEDIVEGNNTAIGNIVNTKLTANNPTIEGYITGNNTAIGTVVEGKLTANNSAIGTVVEGKLTANNSAIGTVVENKLTANNPTIEGYITGNNDTISTIVSNVVGTTEVKVPVVKNIERLVSQGSYVLTADAYISFYGNAENNRIKVTLYGLEQETVVEYGTMSIGQGTGQYGPFPKYTGIAPVVEGKSIENTYIMYLE